MIPHIGVFIEEAWFEAHSKADGTHDFNVEIMASCKERLHRSGEHSAGGVVGPVVGVAWLVVAANLKGFFEVGVDVAKGGHERGVGELGYFFAAVGDVAAIGFGGGLGGLVVGGHGIRVWPFLEGCRRP